MFVPDHSTHTIAARRGSRPTVADRRSSSRARRRSTQTLVRTVIAATAALVVWAALAHDSGAGGPGHRYRVERGDTLWSIAVERYAGDPRAGVYDLQQRNQLSSATITPGQVLSVP
jgi:nucleoid-associated protein YgaU